MIRRVAPALGLFFLAPLSAEYLIGYDESVGRPVELIGGLLILGPLYGGPALIIREVVRRSGRGWPSVLLLAAAFGLVQAGLVDQSMFNPSYRDIEDWDDKRNPTFIPAAGFSAHMALNSIVGHVIWSISAPIAVMETLVPRRSTTPWLGAAGLTITAVLYVFASLLILSDHVDTQQFLAPVAQLAGAAAVVVLLVVAAFLVRPRPPGTRRRPIPTRSAPAPWLVGIIALTVFIVYTMLPPTWLGVGAAVALLATMAVSIARLSRWDGWGGAHRLALAGGALVAYALLAFVVEPLGSPPLAAKLAHNTVFALGVAVLLAAAGHCLRAADADQELRDRQRAKPGSPSSPHQ